jgi:hypothetical protein
MVIQWATGLLGRGLYSFLGCGRYGEQFGDHELILFRIG